MATVLTSRTLPVQIVREVARWPTTLKIGTAIVAAIVAASRTTNDRPSFM